MRHSLLIIASIVVLSVLVAALPAAARRPIAIGIADPAGRDLSTLETHIAQNAGTLPRLWALWSDWGGRGGSSTCQPGQGTCAFPADSVRRLQERGITPVIWWQPTDPANPAQGLYERYEQTLAGKHDAYLVEWARAARAAGEATGKPILLRYAHEATGYWFPWSVGRFDNTKENYKAAWRYVWRIFKREGALPWVRFVWSTVFPYKWAYPGDRYVKLVGLTVLNFGENRRWRNPGPLIDKRVKASKRITARPILIAELATDYLGGDKARWLKQAYQGSYEKHPSIWAIMYLDTDEPHRIAGQPDWRLVKPDDGSALRMYQSIASSRRFQGTIR
jgi:hypothetical protein